MAFYDGHFDLTINKDSLSDSDRSEFEQFLRDWEKTRTLDCDWMEGFNYDNYSAIIYDMNTPETIEDLHSFLDKVVIKFKSIEAFGDGHCSDDATGEWQMDYKFHIQNGELFWDEKVEEYEGEFEEY